MPRWERPSHSEHLSQRVYSHHHHHPSPVFGRQTPPQHLSSILMHRPDVMASGQTSPCAYQAYSTVNTVSKTIPAGKPKPGEDAVCRGSQRKNTCIQELSHEALGREAWAQVALGRGQTTTHLHSSQLRPPKLAAGPGQAVRPLAETPQLSTALGSHVPHTTINESFMWPGHHHYSTEV